MTLGLITETLLYVVLLRSDVYRFLNFLDPKLYLQSVVLIDCCHYDAFFIYVVG